MRSFFSTQWALILSAFALLLSVGCSNSDSTPTLDCDSDPVTPLPENFSAEGYWTLNLDLQSVYPLEDSVALARHYCKYGAAEERPFGEEPIYSSSSSDKHNSSDLPRSSSDPKSSEGNSSSQLPNSSNDLSSSTVTDDCERTLVEDVYFFFRSGDTETNNPILRGWTEGGVSRFAPGEKLVPQGYDCNSAVEVAFIADGDTYNLFLVSVWHGENFDSTLTEKVIVRKKPSSSSHTQSSQSTGDLCSGYPEWDSVPWPTYEKTTLYSFDGGLYRCEATTTPATCAWPPDNEWSDWTFVKKCDGAGSSVAQSSSKPSSSSSTLSSSKPSSSSVAISSSKPSSSSLVVSSSSKPSSSSSAISSSSNPSSSSVVVSSSSLSGHCVLSWFTESMFNNFFPNRHPNYTWSAFQQALNMVPTFICGGQAGSDQAKQKRELAAVFAHWGQEVAHLKYVEEICGTQGTCLNSYNTDWSNGQWPPVPGKSYHGRGAKQISWPGNYGMASQFLFGDKNVLLSNPERVKNEGNLAFATSFWYWISNQNGKTCSNEFWNAGFGATTMVINGSLECNGVNPGAVANRETFYGQYLQKLGVSDPRSYATGCH